MCQLEKRRKTGNVKNLREFRMHGPRFVVAIFEYAGGKSK
jgi:hypothetical protein